MYFISATTPSPAAIRVRTWKTTTPKGSGVGNICKRGDDNCSDPGSSSPDSGGITNSNDSSNGGGGSNGKTSVGSLGDNTIRSNTSCIVFGTSFGKWFGSIRMRIDVTFLHSSTITSFLNECCCRLFPVPITASDKLWVKLWEVFFLSVC